MRIPQRELEVLGVLYVPDDLKIDVDDVFVRGQHQPFVVVAPASCANGFGAVGGYVKDFGSDKRPRGKIQPLCPDARKLPKEEFDRLLFRAHGIKACHPPDDSGRHQTQTHCAAGELGACAAHIPARAAGVTSPAFAAHEDAQLFLTLFHQIVDLGHLTFVATRTAPATTGGPLPSGPVAVATIVPTA